MQHQHSRGGWWDQLQELHDHANSLLLVTLKVLAHNLLIAHGEVSSILRYIYIGKLTSTCSFVISCVQGDTRTCSRRRNRLLMPCTLLASGLLLPLLPHKASSWTSRSADVLLLRSLMILSSIRARNVFS